MTLYAPIPRVVPGTGSLDLIRRLLRPSVPEGTVRIDLVTTTTLRVSVLDSGADAASHVAEGDTVVHVLWQRHEEDAWIEVAGERFPIAPGDTVAIPAGDSWSLSPHQLTVTVARRKRRLAMPIPPHHGSEQFAGYNRCTSYEVRGLQRWKITGPLIVPAGDDRVLLSLYSDVALQHRSGVDLMQQGDIRVVRSGTGDVTVVPNGLAYLLVIAAN